MAKESGSLVDGVGNNNREFFEKYLQYPRVELEKEDPYYIKKKVKYRHNNDDLIGLLKEATNKPIIPEDSRDSDIGIILGTIGFMILTLLIFGNYHFN